MKNNLRSFNAACTRFVNSTRTRTVLGLAAIAAVASADGGTPDALTTAYTTSAQSLADGLKANAVALMPILGTMMLVAWGPRIGKRLIKSFTS